MVTRPNQVWSADITYVPMAKGFMYLVAIIDWCSRYVLAWPLSNTLDTRFCLDALDEPWGKVVPRFSIPTKGSSSPALPLPAA